MSKTVKVNIGKKEYSLTGEDDAMIVATADKVNEQFKLIEKDLGNMPEGTMAILAALNIAENDIKNEKMLRESVTHLHNELTSMSNLLKDAIS